MKTVITQKVLSVPSPAAHGATLVNQVKIAGPDVKEGLIPQTSLSFDRQQRTSVFVVGLALSLGTCELVFSSLSATAYMAKGSHLSEIPAVSGIPTVDNIPAGSTEDIYMQQLRQDVSSLRTRYQGTDAGLIEPTQTLVAQRTHSYFSNRRSVSHLSAPSYGNSADFANGISIPVPAPRSWSVPSKVQAVKYTQIATGSYNNVPVGNTDYTAPPVGYIWPTKGSLTSGYGRRWGRMHQGIDIAGPIGTPIVAAAAGTVISVDYQPSGYGKVVDIQHADGTITRYGHNNRIWVAAGQQVQQGQQIADLGSTGRSTGPHLHFEIRMNGGGAVNPIAYLPSSRS